ncbi:Phosphoribosylamine--glycine ligase [Salinivirga cyanobacteriivorans]|uniref:Phosphoribosylamine--glycine ligase n=1 Tax=Salinivirga cyanobacteriivorans TaxID=1307839 RepID=A0A0S2HYB5_9BACT|nr:phosphoribosylamine--glycine ligase [Salinivirga cyanobacteriivorans]ALO15053.1 Phosphoribosylamine--glycine ligase [Salinivirga cyanobacteriivorans]
MNVLILGSGGREHALAWKLSQSKKIDQLYIAPGNGGTQHCGTNIDIAPDDFEAIKNITLKQQIGLVIVGPEAPLVKGLTDFFTSDEELKPIPVVGPTKAGAELEGSKDFAKAFMQEFKIPTAQYQSFTKDTLNEGKKFLETLKAPWVLKADGLAAGKGVLILEDIDEAKIELENMLGGKFGEASSTVVIEEFLKGIEVSCFCYTNGKDYVMLPEAKDYKRIGEGDTGLNTGGMGSISPVPFADDKFLGKVQKQIVEPTIEGLQTRGITYHGFIFFGLMNVDGNPYVIEYNVRLGDPETESILPRIKTDLMNMFEAGINDQLSDFELEFDARHAAAVMLVSGGYPEAYEKGKTITGLNAVKDSIVLHAGTKINNNETVTSGGRVMAITSLDQTMEAALSTSMDNAEKIKFDKKYYRKDLGFDLK